MLALTMALSMTTRETNQSEIVQKAIDDVAAAGGGRLILPKGTYRFAKVLLRSNVHLLIEKDTVIKPYWPEGEKTVVFDLDAERPTQKKKMTLDQEKAFIENVSIRGFGGRWIIDFSDRERKKGEGVRGIVAKMVRNFLIADLDVKDNFTVYCGITLTPLQAERDTRDWPVSRANRRYDSQLSYLQRQPWLRANTTSWCKVGPFRGSLRQRRGHASPGNGSGGRQDSGL